MSLKAKIYLKEQVIRAKKLAMHAQYELLKSTLYRKLSSPFALGTAVIIGFLTINKLFQPKNRSESPKKIKSKSRPPSKSEEGLGVKLMAYVSLGLTLLRVIKTSKTITHKLAQISSSSASKPTIPLH